MSATDGRAEDAAASDTDSVARARVFAASEARVRRVEQQLETAQQIAHLGSWEWDARSNTVLWSDELYRIYGLEPRSCEITFESFLARVHPDDRARTQREVGAALQSGGRFQYPERIVRPDGSVRELETIGEAVHGDAGVVGLVGTCRDVTDERRRDETIRLYADIVQHVQIGLAVWAVDDLTDLGRVTLVAANPAADTLFRRPIAARAGERIFDIFPTLRDSPLPAQFLSVARDGAVKEVAEYALTAPGQVGRTLALKMFPLPGRCVGVAMEDTTAQTRARRLETAAQRAFERMATGATTEEILTTVVLAIEHQSPGLFGSVLLLDDDRAHLRVAAAPSLPEALVAALDGIEISDDGAPFAAAAARNTAVDSPDVESDVKWDPSRACLVTHGLRACWSRPIASSDGYVVGTLSLHARDARTPGADDLAMLSRAAQIAGIAIERRRLDDRMREFSDRLEAAREEERTGIAREIHDELGQTLTAVKLDLAWIARRVNAGQLTPEALDDKVRASTQLIDALIAQVRRISSDLRPGVLDDLGLVAAIEWQASEFQERTGFPCLVSSSAGDLPIDRACATGLFRIFQEALTNVARHAEASEVTVAIERAGGALTLEIKDDGRGIAADQLRNTKSLGLLGVSERARRLGGKATVSGAPGAGTTVFVEVPLRPDATRGAR